MISGSCYLINCTISKILKCFKTSEKNRDKNRPDPADPNLTGGMVTGMNTCIIGAVQRQGCCHAQPKLKKNCFISSYNVYILQYYNCVFSRLLMKWINSDNCFAWSYWDEHKHLDRIYEKKICSEFHYEHSISLYIFFKCGLVESLNLVISGMKITFYT